MCYIKAAEVIYTEHNYVCICCMHNSSMVIKIFYTIRKMSNNPCVCLHVLHKVSPRTELDADVMERV